MEDDLCVIDGGAVETGFAIDRIIQTDEVDADDGTEHMGEDGGDEAAAAMADDDDANLIGAEWLMRQHSGVDLYGDAGGSAGCGWQEAELVPVLFAVVV